MKRILYFFIAALLCTGACKKSTTASNPLETGTPTATLPAGTKQGVTFLNNGTSAIVTLYAPSKTSVVLLGDFNNWQSTSTYQMKLAADGNTWWVQIDNLNPATEYAYQFLVDGNLKIADPYCEKILDPVNDAGINAVTYPELKAYPTGKTTGDVSVMQANQPVYTWKYTSFTRPEKNDLVIYELLIRDFTTLHSYAGALEKLDYLKNLGINAIELMPVAEFDENINWGYTPNFAFAPDKYYGTKTALQNFIDECHGKGIAVIMDIVLNHAYGKSPMVQLYYDQTAQKTMANSPWFNVNATHIYNVGYDFNHESAATKSYSKDVMKHWMQQYKIDGFRFDLAKGFTQKVTTDDANLSAYDASRIAIWKEYNTYIKSIDANNFYVILEDFVAANEEKVLADEGMMLWNNLNYTMNQATMGYWATESDFSWAFYNNHGFSKSESIVNYAESHDEERLNYKNINFGNASGSYIIKENLATSLKREELAAAFLFSIPGPKMIWQFGELGYEFSIDYNSRLGLKPVHWEYFDDVNRKALYTAYARFIGLKKNNSIFNSTSSVHSLNGPVKYIRLNEGTNTVVVVGNFDVVSQTANIDFGSSGTWIDAAGGSITLSSASYQASLAPGEYHIFSKVALKF